MTTSQNPVRRPRKRAVLVGLAAGAAVVVGGAGAALATGGLDRGPDPSPVTVANPVADPAAPSAPAGDAAALNAAIGAAVAAAGGVGAESVEVERGGHEVDVQLPDGADVSAFVAADGTVRVSTERDTADADPDALLTAEAVERVAGAVEGFAPTAVVQGLSADDRAAGDPVHEVDAVQPDGVELELEVAADLTVTAQDVDRPGDDD